MLVLTRKQNESILIDKDIKLTILDIQGDQISIGIEAPSSIKIYRSELWEAIKNENISSGITTDESLEEISMKFKKR